jgi:hypothetical protein
LALATCARTKRALEPLTHSVELWPFFIQRIGVVNLRTCEGDEAFHRLLLQVGCPTPSAAKVALHRWLQLRSLGDVNEDYTLPITNPMLTALADAVEGGQLPEPLPPSPVWDESEITGRKRFAAELALPVAAAKRLRAFQEMTETQWFEAEKLAEHFSQQKRALEWQKQEQRKRRGLLLPCRPWKTLSRRRWVFDSDLPMTFWDDAGRLPEIFWHYVCDPVVICPRTSGRRMLGGSLPFCSYTPEEHVRYIGDMGECILFGAEQQILLRAFKEQGLVFLAVNSDRVSVLKQFLAKASVLYLLGRWKHFPLFQGEGRSSFPWLGGTRWHEGIVYLQQLVRQQLREELLQCEPALTPLREAWKTVREQDEPKMVLWRVMNEPHNLAKLRQAAGDPELCVPKVVLQVEALQERTLDAAPRADYDAALADTDSDVSDAETEAYSRRLKLVDRTLDERPNRLKKSPHILLTFPTARHMLEKCSTPLCHGGRLMPKSLVRWLEDDAIYRALETGSWPTLGHDDLRAEGSTPLPLVRQPLLLGKHIVVMPPWATYVRGLSERAGRGPRDAHAPWEASALEAQPPAGHVAQKYWLALREAQRNTTSTIRHRELVRIYSFCFHQQRMRRCGGDREEAAEGHSAYDRATDTLLASAVDKEKVRQFLEEYPSYFRVRTCTDLNQARKFRGATQGLREHEFAREKLRLPPGRNLDGARYLHGVRLPYGVAGVSARKAVDDEHEMLSQECASLEPELKQEKEEAENRTVAELVMPRWSATVHSFPGLHGSRAPLEAQREDPEFAVVILIAARATDFEKATPSWLPTFCQAHPCVALYPAKEALPTPCYQVQVGSLRLLQRQISHLFEDRRLLLLAVGSEAKRMFADFHLLIRPGLGATDAVALPGEQLPPLGYAEASLTAMGWCSVEELMNDENANSLCALRENEALRRDWINLRQQLKAAAAQQSQPTMVAPLLSGGSEQTAAFQGSTLAHGLPGEQPPPLGC